MSSGTVDPLNVRCRYLYDQWALLPFKVSAIPLGVAQHSKSNESAEVLQHGCTGHHSSHRTQAGTHALATTSTHNFSDFSEMHYLILRRLEK